MAPAKADLQLSVEQVTCVGREGGLRFTKAHTSSDGVSFQPADADSYRGTIRYLDGKISYHSFLL